MYYSSGHEISIKKQSSKGSSMFRAVKLLVLLVTVAQESNGDCYTNAIGVSNQDTIPDSQITDSSELDVDHQAAYGRLNGDRGDGWCTLERKSIDDWLQVDLGGTYDVCGVATQGDIKGYKSYVISFKLSFSSDGNTWTIYQDENGQDKVFRRNYDRTISQHQLTAPVSASFIRFNPLTSSNWNCLRVEVYGSKVDTETAPVVDGGWSKWSEWGSCSKTCRGGTKTRTRTCTRPPPENGGQECMGESTKSRECKRKIHCSVDGGWSKWSKWGSCNKTCRGGTKTRTRTCTRPPPMGEGQECLGHNTKSTECKRKIAC